MNSLRKKSFDKLMESSYSDKVMLSENENSNFLNKQRSDIRGIDIRRQIAKNSIPKRKQNHGYCANINCNNLKSKRRKFQNKSYYYCNVLFLLTKNQECANIIDAHEYCHICFEISCAETKEWIACESCGCWVHIKCEESSRNGIKNLSLKLGPDPDNSKYTFYCMECRGSPNVLFFVVKKIE